MALLGAILVNNAAHAKVSEFLLPEHFYEPVHAHIYEAVEALIARDQLANPVTLAPYFERDDALAQIGGPEYLAKLAASAVTVIDAEDYGRTIYDLAIRRELIAIGEDVVNTAYDSPVSESASDQIEAAEQYLFHLAEKGQHEGDFQPFRTSLRESIEMVEAAYKRDGQLTGVPTGFRDMDAKLGGLHASDLIILAGRPSMGKTALATNIAFNAAKSYRTERDEHGAEKTVDGAVVGFFSLEMSAEQLASRILASESRISSEKLRRGILDKDQFVTLVQKNKELEELPLFIDDTPALTIGAVRTRARRLKRTHNLGAVVVDYLQLLRPSGRRPNDNRVQEISEITQGLKALAKELDIPVIALSQLSRAVEQREDKRPQLADLRESGTIEQDADVVMFVYRDEYYVARREPQQDTPEHESWKEEMERVHNLAEVIVGKQRHGPTGRIVLQFQAEFTQFHDLARPDYSGDEF
jgi:replicative DNA helicase